MRLNFSLWRENPENKLPNWRLEFLIAPYSVPRDLAIVEDL